MVGREPHQRRQRGTGVDRTAEQDHKVRRRQAHNRRPPSRGDPDEGDGKPRGSGAQRGEPGRRAHPRSQSVSIEPTGTRHRNREVGRDEARETTGRGGAGGVGIALDCSVIGRGRRRIDVGLAVVTLRVIGLDGSLGEHHRPHIRDGVIRIRPDRPADPASRAISPDRFCGADVTQS